MKQPLALTIILFTSLPVLAEADYSGIVWLPLYLLAMILCPVSLLAVILSASSKVKFAKTKIILFLVVFVSTVLFLFFGP